MEKGELLTIEQVAKIFQMKPQTIYKWAQDGVIPGAKLGKEWRFRRQMLDEWLDTTIALSKGGFEFMLHRTWLSTRTEKPDGSELDEMLKIIKKRTGARTSSPPVLFACWTTVFSSSRRIIPTVSGCFGAGGTVKCGRWFRANCCFITCRCSPMPGVRTIC